MGYRARTTGLFAFMVIFFVAVGYVLGGFFGNWLLGTLFFLGIAAAMNIFTYFYSSKLILKHYDAKVIEEKDNPELYNIVKEVAYEADIEMPKVALVPMSNPNAFATGRNEENAVVAVTEGIMRTLNEEELKGVISHEIAHIKDRDMLIMSLAATLAGAIAFMSRMVWFHLFLGRRRVDPRMMLVGIIFMVLAPIGAIIIKMAISRKREYLADEKGAEISKNPNALASALQKLKSANERNPIKEKNPTTSSLFIVNPFKKSRFVNLFSSHPPMEKRIEKLQKMATNFSYL